MHFHAEPDRKDQIFEQTDPKTQPKERQLYHTSTRFKLLVAAIIGFEILFIGFTKYQSILTGVNLFTENTFYTRVSAVQISLIAATALINSLLTGEGGLLKKPYLTWLYTAAFTTFLGFDETFELHEAISKYSGEIFRLIGLQVKSSLWDIPLFLGYAVIAYWLWYGLKKDMSVVPLARLFGFIGVAMLALSIFFDIGLHKVVPIVWEDGFKLLGFLFIWLSFLTVTIFKLRFRKISSV